jgi:TatD DNase family protein
MRYYDCHTHLNHQPLDAQADEIANKCKTLNITLNDIGTNLVSSQLAITHAKKHENVFATVGIHPNDVKTIDLNTTIQQLETWLKNEDNKIVAIGETGLDYHYPPIINKNRKIFLLPKFN